MQQLFGDKAEAMDPSLLRGHFIQRLPSNVRMILASTAKGSNLLELAEMVDSASIATVATPQDNELGKLKAKVAGGNFQTYRPLGSAEATAEATGELNPDHVLHRNLGYVGTTDVWEILLGNVYPHALSRETIQPAARSDEHCWPYIKLPILYNRPCFIRTKIPD